MSPTWSYMNPHIIAHAMSQTWSYIGRHIITDAMSQTWSYTSSSMSVPMLCLRHGLTLTHLVADACPKHVLQDNLMQPI